MNRFITTTALLVALSAVLLTGATASDTGSLGRHQGLRRRRLEGSVSNPFIYCAQINQLTAHTFSIYILTLICPPLYVSAGPQENTL